MALKADKIDFLIDPITNDLDVSGGVLHFSSGVRGVAQGVSIRVKMLRGEWFLNQSIGLPLLARKDGLVTRAEAILGEKFDQGKATRALRDTITAAPGVVSALVAKADFNRRTRKLSMSWQVSSAFGDTALESAVV